MLPKSNFLIYWLNHVCIWSILLCMMTCPQLKRVCMDRHIITSQHGHRQDTLVTWCQHITMIRGVRRRCRKRFQPAPYSRTEKLLRYVRTNSVSLMSCPISIEVTSSIWLCNSNELKCNRKLLYCNLLSGRVDYLATLKYVPFNWSVNLISNSWRYNDLDWCRNDT